MRRIIRAHRIRLVAFLLLPGAAGAAPEKHDGFLLRLAIGPGLLQSETQPKDLAVDPLTFRGTATVFSLSIGGVLGRSFALHGDFLMATLEDPGVEWGTHQGALDGTLLAFVGIGIGTTWFHQPTNVRVSASLLSPSLDIDRSAHVRGDEKPKTEDGVGLALSVGKEWFISDEWGLGLAATAMGALSMQSTDADGEGPDLATDTRAGLISLQASATYN